MDDLCEKTSCLEIELSEVKDSVDEYLPKYGYSHRDEVVELIQEEIENLKNEIAENESGYTEEEVEEERACLCYSQGLSRYC